ncbi:hypothetical protein LK07_21655 [Streptomyces pluripotens]|uniref:Uncharacterized protein n=1 Tax=Streptomyces pluripotens TaxID=1355015 RepID=A0A221P1Z6_9ACTN|nr:MULTISPECIES: hypothetical protein [Streptomyces]ARP71937.1 hypothetical protein LK06_020500 [Streptomyces pluripotens]ASN26184.1 hypothetical protein LK07_21655 [Streptomyces pluripotens]KIE26355.1 hypothetical protein LK08_14210 [Streptomyces sp. MUSC 125]MCH0556432.1 hypothetical protein [Streptomyces sp. MUM 16J]
MSLVELIAQADERGLAASGLACLDRCIPLLGVDDEVLRPLWASLAGRSDWGESLEKARGALDPAQPDDDEAARLARRMLEAAPAERTADGIRAWADACSVASLRIHRLLDPAADGAEPDEAADGLEEGRAGRSDAGYPLVAAELRRQVTVLELLADHGATGLRQALEVSVEGRRVLRAVVSRRLRGRT